MKRLVLSALLLSSSFAVAGGAAQPVTASTLRLSAPVGTAVNYQTTTKTRVQLGDVTVTARPGAEVDQETLDLTRDAIQQGFSQNMQNMTQTFTGQTTYRVTGRDAAGNVTLSTRVTQSSGAAGDITINLTERVAPGGQRQVTGVKVDSADPQVQAIFSKFTPEQLNALSGQQGGSANLYSMPLVQGKGRTVTSSADVQGFLGGLLGSLPGAASVDLKSSPLKVTETTTYTGLNAQGLHAFASSFSAQPWKLDFTLPGDAGNMNITLSRMSGKATMLYRRDGLLADQSTTTDMQMRLSMTMDDQVVDITMNMQQEMTLKQK
ncbi:hypothetical protein [Deinococcus wulumuqiensis]|uniref:hypothetical protein n=1 Tax=Deinococcus wulumuqiensis TaxID=980427 RepID=UPI0013C31E6E|nr:hypothetical protein [Deinococcus wulumuqiensis]